MSSQSTIEGAVTLFEEMSIVSSSTTQLKEPRHFFYDFLQQVICSTNMLVKDCPPFHFCDECPRCGKEHFDLGHFEWHLDFVEKQCKEVLLYLKTHDKQALLANREIKEMLSNCTELIPMSARREMVGTEEGYVYPRADYGYNIWINTGVMASKFCGTPIDGFCGEFTSWFLTCIVALSAATSELVDFYERIMNSFESTPKAREIILQFIPNTWHDMLDTIVPMLSEEEGAYWTLHYEIPQEHAHLLNFEGVKLSCEPGWVKPEWPEIQKRVDVVSRRGISKGLLFQLFTKCSDQDSLVKFIEHYWYPDLWGALPELLGTWVSAEDEDIGVRNRIFDFIRTRCPDPSACFFLTAMYAAQQKNKLCFYIAENGGISFVQKDILTNVFFKID